MSISSLSARMQEEEMLYWIPPMLSFKVFTHRLRHPNQSLVMVKRSRPHWEDTSTFRWSLSSSGRLLLLPVGWSAL